MSETTTILTEAFDTPNESGSTEPIPVGQYVASIKDINVAQTKSKKGQSVNATYEIEEGPYAGRLVWDRMIISHENKDAMRIGRQKFKDVATAVGINEAITDLAVLCHKPMSVSVKIESDDTGQYPDKNKIGRVKKLEAAKKPNGGDGKPYDDDVDF